AGLTRVRVADDSHVGHLVGAPAPTLGVPDCAHGSDLTAQLGDPAVDAPPVGLQLGFPGPTGTDSAIGATTGPAGLPGQRLAPAPQPRQEVTQLGQLDLCLTLPGPRVLGEDVQ